MGDFHSMRPTREKKCNFVHMQDTDDIKGFRIFVFKAHTLFFASAIKKFMKKEVDERYEKLSY